MNRYRNLLQPQTYLLLRFLGLQQGVPVCNGLAWISQHFVPVVPAKSFGVASNPHHTNDLIMTYPVGTHTYCITASDLTWHDISYIKLLFIIARRAFLNERRHKSESGCRVDCYSESTADCLCGTRIDSSLDGRQRRSLVHKQSLNYKWR